MAACVGTGCHGWLSFGARSPPEGKRFVVSVRLHGNDALRDGTIREAIRTHSDNWSVGQKPVLDESLLPADARRIESLYAAHGYFDARVTERRVETIGDEWARIHFHVNEGRAYRIGEVELEGVVPDAPRGPDAETELRAIEEELTEGLPVRAGRIWTESRQERSKKRVRQSLRDAGFVHARVLGRARVDRSQASVSVRIQVVPGPRVRVASIRIEGEQALTKDRIRRRIRIETGDVPTAERLQATERSVHGLQFFFAVQAAVEKPSNQEVLEGSPKTVEALRAVDWPAEVPVVLSVQERPARELRGGYGIRADNARSETYVLGGFRHRNVFGGARYLDVELRPAFIVLPGFLDPDVFGPGGDASITFREPSFFEEYLAFMARSDYELTVERGYRNHSLRGTVSLSRSFGRWVDLELGYGLDYRNFFNVDPALRVAESQRALGVAFRSDYLITAPEQTLTVDTRAGRLDPRAGLYARVRLQESLKAVGSDFDFFRILGDVRGYMTPWRFMTVALRFKAGRVVDLGNEGVPLSSRLHGGGASDHRGFGSRGMGPVLCRDQDTPFAPAVSRDAEGCTGRKIFVGGNVSMLATAELRWYLPANIGLVTFVDVGQVWGTGGDVDLSKLEVAVGPGARYFTPFGPIRFDVGLLLTGRSPPGYAFHFGIGQAF